MSQDDIGISMDGIDAEEDIPSTSFISGTLQNEPQKNPFTLKTSENFELNIAIQ